MRCHLPPNFALLAIALLTLTGCAARRAEPAADRRMVAGASVGNASYYADKFQGRPTASAARVKRQPRT